MNYLKKKRLALMKSKTFHGYMKTAGGYPLTLSDCMENGLINLTIYGNSVQDGTPSPESAIDVQSVGDKTKNLFTCDLDTISNNKIYYDKSTQIFNLMLGGQQISQSIYTLPSAIPKGTQLTITVYFISGNISGTISIGGYHKIDGETKNWQCSVSFPKDIDLSGQAVSKTVVTTDTLTDFWIFCNAGSTVNTETKFKVQIEYGEGASEYEPYGYKIPVKINDNIINIYQDTPLYYLESSNGREAVYNNIVIDYKNKKAKLENTIAYLTISGEESGWYDTGEKNGLNRYIIPGGAIEIPAGDRGGYTQMISNCFIPGGNKFGEYIENTCGAYISNNSIGWIGFCVSVAKFPDVQSFKDWVHDKYINNNQLYVLINTGTVQVTDISSDVNLDLLPNIKEGVNIISAETVLEPSNMEANYYSDIQEG